jgi:ubiquinone/menaquinone biosynthesis C-methylase UbiE
MKRDPGQAVQAPQVPETRFGKWFLRTETWTVHVLERAMQDLVRLIPQRRQSYPVVVDVGCGGGRSLKKLHERFAPDQLIAIDIDPAMLEVSAQAAASDAVPVTLIAGSSSRLPLQSNSVDLLFCHQTFHHLVEQEQAIQEFFRVLKPGGIMLFAESTRQYIESWIIMLLFRHPMEVQRTAAEYLQMVRAAGFTAPPQSISYPYLWWSRPDLGIMERWLRIAPAAGHEETLLNLVATKPHASAA